MALLPALRLACPAGEEAVALLALRLLLVTFKTFLRDLAVLTPTTLLPVNA